MVIRHYIICETCGEPYTLRISLGHNPHQEHTIQCIKCKEPIKIQININFSTLHVEILCVENCKKGRDEGIVLNLHPELPVPPDMLHQDFICPWQHFVQNHFPIELEKTPDVNLGYIRVKSVYGALGGRFEIYESWLRLKKAWSLYLHNKVDLAANFLQEYKNITDYQEDLELDQVLFHFCSVLISPGKWHIFENAASKISEIYRKHPNEFKKFISFYKKEFFAEHFERYFDIFSEYFKGFSDFNQILLYSKNNRNIDETFHVSSKNFKRTKMFYGNAFEVITSSFTVLACLNNILNGRSFDEFESMNLSKFLKINKANRANPFKDTDCFRVFSDCLDSTIRNASHHHSMRMDQNGKLLYRSPGNSNWKSMTYIKYLYLCNEIMLNICALLMIELLIIFHHKK